MTPPTGKVKELVHRYPTTTLFLFYISVVVTISLLLEVTTNG